jgi:hypothetical protein
MIDFRKLVDVSSVNMLIDLMHGLTNKAKFGNGTDICDKARIRCAAAC